MGSLYECVAYCFVLSVACTSGQTEEVALDRDALLDPAACAGCHPTQYDEWASSMHAYAADDPLFIAMNRRGQREGEIGSFCVECHAPMAVRTGATADGLNLHELPRKLKGVTCYFCHNVEAITGTHNAGLGLADDTIMRGPFDDPVATRAHGSQYSELVDRDRLDSAQLCGVCHDIVNARGVHLERTYAEWQGSVYAQSAGGTTCGQCHMPQSTNREPIATQADLPKRRLHSHLLPGVDLALTDFPDRDVQRAAVLRQLDTTLQKALCVRGSEQSAEVQVVLDNAGAGHNVPSGSAQDRRLWIEVVAYSGDEVIYQSGVVPPGTPVTELDDPDLWLVRDCMLDEADEPVHMFWEAHDVESNLLPAPTTFDRSDPRYYDSHVYRTFPSTAPLAAFPDRVELTVYLRAFDLSVFDDLVASGDLTDGDEYTVAALREQLEPLQVGPKLVWTPDAVTEEFVDRLLPVQCVADGSLRAADEKVLAPSLERCVP